MLVWLAEMVDLVENVTEIAKITNYHGRSLASDEVCSDKTCVDAVNKCQNRREKYWLVQLLGG